VDANGVLDRANLGEIPASQDGLNALAVDTGGRAQRNSSSITNWVSKTLEDTSNYYLLAWHSENEQADKKFKQIEVRIVGRPDLNVRLPRGYVTGAESIQTKNAKNSGDKIAFERTEDQDPKKPTIKKIMPLALSLNYLDAPHIGGVLTSSIEIADEALDFSGGAPATVDLAGIIFNDQGKQVGDFKTGLKIAKPTQDQGASDTRGVIYNNRTPLAPGIYQVKVAARESQTGQVGTAAQWIEIPDLTKKELTLGSLFLGLKELKNSDKPDTTQIQFSVDHQFSQPLQLSFVTFIYNASPRAGGGPDLTAATEVFDAKGQKVIDLPMRPISLTGATDISRIPLSGAIRNQPTVPGIYLLRVTVNDLATRTTATAEAMFTVK
jgi:hypothetical protein